MTKLIQGDCLEILKTIPDNSVDFILTDLPYGTTACKWDNVIPFEPMWDELNRVIKKDRAIALFGSEPFSSALRMSNKKKYKYDWIWNKNTFANQYLAHYEPLKITENISVFNSKVYYPQGLIEYNQITKQGTKITDNIGGGKRVSQYVQKYTNYPKNVLNFKRDKSRYHSTQKPVALLEYLIKTYTKEGETVLDFTMGSGSTGVACINTGRDFIGIELDPRYYKIAVERISDAQAS